LRKFSVTFGIFNSYIDIQLVSQEAQHGEDGESGEDAGEAIAEADDHGVADDVVVEFVVRGQSDETSASHGQGKENLKY